MKALVVFSDGDAVHPLGRFLRPGFRHCFACVLSNGLWLQVDGRLGVPVFKYLTTGDFDLATFYRDKGYTVVETEQRDRAVTWPLVLRSCTGLVKAALCIRSWSLTPHQLYRHLTEG